MRRNAINRAFARLGQAIVRVGTASARAAARAARAASRAARRAKKEKLVEENSQAGGLGKKLIKSQSLPANLNQFVGPVKDVKRNIDIKSSLKRKVSLVIRRDSKTGSILALNVSPARATVRGKFRKIGKKLAYGTAFTLFFVGVAAAAGHGLEVGIAKATNSTPLSKDDILDAIDEKYETMDARINETIKTMENLGKQIDLSVAKIPESRIKDLNKMSAQELIDELEIKLLEDGITMDISTEDVDDLDREFKEIDPKTEQNSYITSLKELTSRDADEEDEENDDEGEEHEERKEFMEQVIQSGKKEWEKIKKERNRLEKKRNQLKYDGRRKKRSASYEAVAKVLTNQRLVKAMKNPQECSVTLTAYICKNKPSKEDVRYVWQVCRKAKNMWKQYRVRNKRSIWEVTEEEEEKFWETYLEKAKKKWDEIKRKRINEMILRFTDRANGYVNKIEDGERTKAGWNSQDEHDVVDGFEHATWGRKFNPFTRQRTHPFALNADKDEEEILNVSDFSENEENEPTHPLAISGRSKRSINESSDDNNTTDWMDRDEIPKSLTQQRIERELLQRRKKCEKAREIMTMYGEGLSFFLFKMFVEPFYCGGLSLV